jgi:hypothetical protein
VFTPIEGVGDFLRIISPRAMAAERDCLFEQKYLLRHKVDDSDSLADDFKVYSYYLVKKLFKVRKSKQKKKLKKVLLRAAKEAIRGYYVAVDGRETVRHDGVQCDDGPSPQKKLRLKKTIAPSSMAPATAAPTVEISKPVPRGQLTKDVYKPKRQSPPKVTENLRGMVSLGRHVVDELTSPNKKRTYML